MKASKVCALSVILILILMMPSCFAKESGTLSVPAADKDVEAGVSTSKDGAEWTILYYFGADCDLEASMLDNLKQILEVGSSLKVNVVMLADRSPE